MSVLEQVQWETSVRKRYAAITFLAAVLIVVSQLIQLSGQKATVTELTLNLVVANLRTTRNIIAAVLQGSGLIGLGILLMWMQRIAKARNPEMRPFVRYLAIVGFFVDALATVVLTVVTAIKAHEFVTTGNQSYPEANHLVSTGIVLVLSLLQELGALLLAVGFVLIALNTMRVGLLNRWLGYSGVLAGALILFPVGGIAPIIQGFWLAAVAVLLFGRWPNGDFPAWESGVAVSWQPMQQTSGPNARVRREPRPRQQRRRGGMGQLPTIVEPEQPPAETSETAVPRQPQKRKRKRRS